MKIGGLDKTSLVDWPGMIAATVFTAGCNLDCFFCHNRALIKRDGQPAALDPDEVLTWLGERVGFLDGVVISGGEPTLQPGLTDFVRRVRDLGYRVKLDTNGTLPDIVRDLVHQELVDYIAMDVKAPMEKYEHVCGVPVDHGTINATIDLLLQGRVDYEFRTTCVPQLTEDDMVAISRRIAGARRYVLQQYQPEHTSGAKKQNPSNETPHTPGWAARVIQKISSNVAAVYLRGFVRDVSVAQSSAA